MKKPKSLAQSSSEMDAQMANTHVQRFNVTMPPPVMQRIHTLMVHRGFLNRSEFLAALVREEYDRRAQPKLLPLPKALPT
jgi:hypothetical protein